jgi:hypothetical protein
MRRRKFLTGAIGLSACSANRQGRGSDDIPFNRSFDLPPGQVEEMLPGVRRLAAAAA